MFIYNIDDMQHYSALYNKERPRSSRWRRRTTSAPLAFSRPLVLCIKLCHSYPCPCPRQFVERIWRRNGYGFEFVELLQHAASLEDCDVGRSENGRRRRLVQAGGAGAC